MPSPCSLKPFLIKNDLINSIKNHLKTFVFSLVFAALGAVLGVLVARKMGASEAPYSAIAKLFRLSFAPFSYVFPYMLRFILYLLIASLGFFLPLPLLYPAVALFFFGKSIAQTVTVAFLTDSVASSVLFLVLIALPLFFAGMMCLFYLNLKVSELKICCGSPFNGKTVAALALYLSKFVLLYFLLLIALFFLLCGAFYLIVIAL